MKDNISIIFAAIIGTFLIVILPLFSILDRQDSMSYNVVLTQTTKFVDDVRNKGFIDRESYYNYISALASTSNTYKVDIEAYKKVLIHATDENGDIIENEWVEEIELYNTRDILKVIDSENTSYNIDTGKTNNVYLFDENDEIYVKVRNTNITAGSIIYKLIAGTANTEVINISYGGVINNINWQLYDKITEKVKKAPEVILTVPTNENGNANIKKITDKGVFDVSCSDEDIASLSGQELQDVLSLCEGTNLSLSTEGYTYLNDLTREENQTIKLSVELKNIESLNIGQNETTLEEEYKPLDEIDETLFNQVKYYIIDNFISLNGMYASPDIKLRSDNNYYFFDIILSDVRMSSLEYISTLASVTILPGLGKDADGVLSLGAETVQLELKNVQAANTVVISSPYNWNKIFKVGNIEGARINTSLVHVGMEVAFVISYTGIEKDVEEVLNEVKNELKIKTGWLTNYKNLELYTVDKFKEKHGESYIKSLLTLNTNHIIVKFQYTAESVGLTHIELPDAWIATNNSENPEDTIYALGAKSTEYRVIEDNEKPNPPKILLDGTEGRDGWYVSDVNVSLLDATDNSNGSGVYEHFLKFTGKVNMAYTEYEKAKNEDGNIIISTEGETKAYAYATDYVGHTSGEDQVVIKVDKTSPTAPVIKLTGDKGTNGWYTSQVKVDVTGGTDTISGVDSTSIQITTNGVTSDIDTTSYTLKDNGRYIVTATTTDVAGNKKTVTEVINIDQATPPTATISVIEGSKNTADNIWYCSDVTLRITINKSDAISGLANAKYKLTGPDEQAITEITGDTKDVVLSSNGTHTLTVYTYTNAGLSNTVAYTVQIDKDKPNPPTIKLSGTEGTNGWYTSDIDVTIESNGDVGPSNETQYYIYNISTNDINTQINKGGTLKLNIEGEYTLKVTALDVAGNMVMATQDIKLDKTKPTSAEFVIEGEEGDKDWYTSDVNISYKGGTDETSEIGNIELSHTSVVGNTNGTLVTLKTIDKAGNSVTIEKTIKIDKTLPTIPSITLDEPTGIGITGINVYNKDVNVSITPGLDENVSKTTYQVTKNSGSTVVVPETEGTSFTLNTEGMQTIIVRTYDKTGRYSETSTVVDINKQLPPAPIISKINSTSVEGSSVQTVTGTNGNVTLTLDGVTNGNEVKIHCINQETYEEFEISTIYYDTSEIFFTLPSSGKYSIVVTQTNMYGSTSNNSTGLYYYEY